MEEIIVTYIKQSNEEIDIAIPNDVKAVQIIEAILHHEKIDEALSSTYEIRVAKDKEEWHSIRNDETLRDNDVWDGQYVMLYKKDRLSLPLKCYRQKKFIMNRLNKIYLLVKKIMYGKLLSNSFEWGRRNVLCKNHRIFNALRV